MRKLLIIILFLAPFAGKGQQIRTSFHLDLDFVYARLKKTVSYKTQPENQQRLDQKYQLLKLDSTVPSLAECYIKLYQLVDIISDFHNEIYGYTGALDSQALKNGKRSSTFQIPDKYLDSSNISKNLDSLEKVLSTKKFSDPEGIYYYKQYIRIAIFNRSDSLLEGMVLDSKIPNWHRGEVILYLLPKKYNRFRLFTRRFDNKRFISGLDYFSDGVFRFMGWCKNPAATDFYSVSQSDQPFAIRTLNHRFTYLKLGSFSSSKQGIKDAREFCQTLADSLKTAALIVDLRNNPGGGNKNSDQFYRLLKRYKGKMYVLIHFNTVSNAEQFALRLKKLGNVRLLGDRSRGQLTYGRNSAQDEPTPSGLFKIHFTDLKDHYQDYLPLEGIGITPDIFLSNTKDWVDQILERYDQ